MSVQINEDKLRSELPGLIALFGSMEGVRKFTYGSALMDMKNVTEAQGQSMIQALKEQQVNIKKFVGLFDNSDEAKIGMAFAYTAVMQNISIEQQAAEIAFQMIEGGLDVFEPGVQLKETPAPSEEAAQAIFEEIEMAAEEAFQEMFEDVPEDVMQKMRELIAGSFEEESPEGLIVRFNLDS